MFETNNELIALNMLFIPHKKERDKKGIHFKG